MCKNEKKGFTLIEIMTAIAIVAILAGVVLVSMTAYRSKAQSAKALAQISSVIPSVYSCWGNSGTVTSPQATGEPPGGNAICQIPSGTNSPGYGNWPQIAGDLSSYVYNSSIDNTNKTFVISFTSGTDDRRICCNSALKSCKLLDTAGTNCTATDPSY